MTVLDDIGSAIGSAFSGSGDSPWLKPVLNAGVGLYQANQQANAANNYIGAQQNAQNQNYGYVQDYNKAVQDYLGQYSAVSAANQAAKASAAAAYASAARQQEANRQRAEKKGMSVQTKNFNKAQKYLAPYSETGARLLPQVEQTYGNTLSGINALQAYLSTPEAMAKLNQGTPSYQVNVPLPSYLTGGK